jgi:hypothetical protein
MQCDVHVLDRTIGASGTRVPSGENLDLPLRPWPVHRAAMRCAGACLQTSSACADGTSAEGQSMRLQERMQWEKGMGYGYEAQGTGVER